MEKQEIKKYLRKKNKWIEPITKKEADKTNEKNIEEIKKKGKIYGDPIAEIQW